MKYLLIIAAIIACASSGSIGYGMQPEPVVITVWMAPELHILRPPPEIREVEVEVIKEVPVVERVYVIGCQLDKTMGDDEYFDVEKCIRDSLQAVQGHRNMAHWLEEGNRIPGDLGDAEFHYYGAKLHESCAYWLQQLREREASHWFPLD